MEISPSNSPALSEPSNHEGRARLFSLLWTAFLVVVIAIGFQLGFPIWQQTRADSLAAQAKDALDQKLYQEAQDFVERALLSRPRDPRYLRLAGRVFAPNRKADSFAFYKALYATGETTEVERTELIQLAFLFHRPNVAAPIVQAWLAREPTGAQANFVAALLEDMRRNPAQAREHARAAVRQDPNHREYNMLLGRLLAESGRKDLIEEGKQILMTLASRPESRLAAVRVLLAMDLTKGEIQRLILWMNETRLPTLPDLYMGYELVYRADTNRLGALADEVMSRFTSGLADEQIALGSWLNHHRLFDRTLRALKPDSAIRSPRLAAIYLEALIGAGQWPEALEFARRAENGGAPGVALAAYQRLQTNSLTAQEATESARRLLATNAPAAMR